VGPVAEATLTPLEAALLEGLLARPGAATPSTFWRALWGEAATPTITRGRRSARMSASSRRRASRAR
jgi:hypothetical protein